MGTLAEQIVRFFLYLLRSAARARRLHHIKYWTPLVGSVVKSAAKGGNTEILYTYQFEGGYYSGNDDRDFFWSQSAEEYVAEFTPGAGIRIRVNPNFPEESVISDGAEVEAPGIVWKE